MDVSAGSPCVNTNFLPLLLSGPSPRCSLFFLSLLLETEWRFSSPPVLGDHPSDRLPLPRCQLCINSPLLASVEIILIFTITARPLPFLHKKTSEVANGISTILWKSPVAVPAVPGNPDKAVCSRDWDSAAGAGCCGGSFCPTLPQAAAPQHCRTPRPHCSALPLDPPLQPRGLALTFPSLGRRWGRAAGQGDASSPGWLWGPRATQPGGTGKERKGDAAPVWLLRKEEKREETVLHFVKLMQLRKKTRSCPAGRCASPCPCQQIVRAV